VVSFRLPREALERAERKAAEEGIFSPGELAKKLLLSYMGETDEYWITRRRRRPSWLERRASSRGRRGVRIFTYREL